MKAENTFAIDFITRIKSDRKNAAIFARITVNGDRKEISLKKNIIAKEWDSKSEMVKGKSIEAKAINAYIDEVRFKIKNKYRLLQTEGITITVEQIKDAYLGKNKSSESKHTVIELVHFHIKSKRANSSLVHLKIMAQPNSISGALSNKNAMLKILCLNNTIRKYIGQPAYYFFI